MASGGRASGSDRPSSWSLRPYSDLNFLQLQYPRLVGVIGVVDRNWGVGDLVFFLFPYNQNRLISPPHHPWGWATAPDAQQASDVIRSDYG